MTFEERSKVAERCFEEVRNLSQIKGVDYSDGQDALYNFKSNAERLGLTKYQVWLVYFMKHIDAICSAVRRNPESPHGESEPIMSRVNDALTYLTIFAAMLEEDKLTKWSVKLKEASSEKVEILAKAWDAALKEER